MNIYKITTSKTAFVRAENEDEAEEKYYDEEFMFADETINLIEQSSLQEAQQRFLI